ncbi:MAG: ammonium transporter, partial [Nitrososphaeraceae archaeon]
MSRTRTTTLIILVGLLAGIITMISSTLTSASAYKPDDPAAKYHCFATDADGGYNASLPAFVTPEGDLIPCTIDHGDNAWMLTSSALVLMMTPGGLAIFYGGLTRQKNAVNTLHM